MHELLELRLVSSASCCCGTALKELSSRRTRGASQPLSRTTETLCSSPEPCLLSQDGSGSSGSLPVAPAQGPEARGACAASFAPAAGRVHSLALMHGSPLPLTLVTTLLGPEAASMAQEVSA